MRVLSVTHYFPSALGGIEYVANSLHGEYLRAGHDASWAASVRKGSAAQLPRNSIPLGASDIVGSLTPVPYPVLSPRALLLLIRAVKASDVVHVHDAHYVSCATAVFAARTWNKRVVLTQHVGYVPYRSMVLRLLLWLVTRTLCRLVHQLADHVVFISPQVRDWYSRFVTYKSAPICIANGVDETRFTYQTSDARLKERRALGIPDSQKVYLFVGRFTEKKGLSVLRSVADMFAQDFFLFAGAGKEDPDAWGLSNVRVLGCLPQEAMPPVYGAADLLILPSVGEGFPLVVQEAMSCGLPCMISVEAFSGWAKDAQLFLLVDPEPTSVCRCLGTIDWGYLVSETNRSKISQYARAQWNWDSCARCYMEIMDINQAS